MKLTLVPSCIDDWWVIQKAEHDNKSWLEEREDQLGSYEFVMYSHRFSDADVEGPSCEMLEIAQAIECTDSAHFRRCAVSVVCDRVFFWSPRNSQSSGECTLAEAEELAKEIRSKIESAQVLKTIDK